MMALAGVRPGERCIDLGCGDGRVVEAMAKAGARADGVEINEERFRIASQRLKKNGFTKRVKIYRGSFWERNLSGYDLVTVYGITTIMERLEKKLQAELKPGARVVSNGFSFPEWKADRKLGNVYLYIKK